MHLLFLYAVPVSYNTLDNMVTTIAPSPEHHRCSHTITTITPSQMEAFFLKKYRRRGMNLRQGLNRSSYFTQSLQAMLLFMYGVEKALSSPLPAITGSHSL
ncbi:hypothetical protein L2E82_35462 [Cichorium intybus]|uniref:Uncharacterized protein n=1 Tax=Cichorium intybus TaxID=13427 RepID=A0ACB9BNX7_CICIN|nr:hypothetical protein L2E82_35462 [Cichorium intybus]